MSPTLNERDRVPAFLLERLHQEELDPEEAARVRLRGGIAVDEALRSLARADRTFLEVHPPARVVAQLRSALSSNRENQRTGRAWRAWWLPVAGLAVLPFWVVSNTPVQGRPDPLVEVTRDKGDGPAVKVWKRAGSMAVRLGADSVVKANDVLQLGVGGAGTRFGVLLSIDGRGVVTRHGPEGGTLATQWPGQGEVRLDQSYTLDDAPGFERFVLVLNDAPFDATDVLQAAQRLGPDDSSALPLPVEFTQVSFVVRKEER